MRILSLWFSRIQLGKSSSELNFPWKHGNTHRKPVAGSHKIAYVIKSRIGFLFASITFRTHLTLVLWKYCLF